MQHSIFSGSSISEGHADPRLFLVSIVFSIKSVYTKIYDHPSPEQKKKEEKEEEIEDQIEFTIKNVLSFVILNVNIITLIYIKIVLSSLISGIKILVLRRKIYTCMYDLCTYVHC